MADRFKESKRLYTAGKKDRTVQFGKYATRTLTWVAKNDPEYFKQIKDLYYSKYDVNKQIAYRNITARFFKDDGEYTKQRSTMVGICLEHRRAGVRVSEIKELLHRLYKGVSESLLNSCIEEARATLKKEFEIEKDNLVNVHTLRYEELYEKALTPNMRGVSPQYKLAVEADAYLNALEILVQKEKMLGIHTRNFKIQVNNIFLQKQAKTAASFNLDLLTLQEQIELLQLIELTKIDDVVKPVMTVAAPEPVVEKEISHEVVIEAPIREAEQTDVIGKQRGEEVKKQGKSLIEIQETMQETIRKQIEEAFKRQNKT